MDLLDLAQNRDKWRTVLIAVMNLLFPYSENFFD